VTANGKIRAIDIDTGDTLWEFSDIPSNEEPMVAADERSVTFIDEISDNYVMISIDPLLEKKFGGEIWRRILHDQLSLTELFCPRLKEYSESTTEETYWKHRISDRSRTS